MWGGGGRGSLCCPRVLTTPPARNMPHPYGRRSVLLPKACKTLSASRLSLAVTDFGEAAASGRALSPLPSEHVGKASKPRTLRGFGVLIIYFAGCCPKKKFNMWWWLLMYHKEE